MALPVAAEISGTARIVDGDTLVLSGESIRLHGIDAPERTQTCKRADGSRWSCGIWAGDLLAALVAERPVTCDGHTRDRYGRIVATCAVAGRDLGRQLVERGAAHAYRKYSLDYVESEKRALSAAVGIWQGAHLSPAAHRAGAIPDAQPQPAAGCAIKGNISKSGRIYHSPGQRDYDRTRIDERRGERWFCSEGAAVAAGWRAAQR